VSAIPSRIGGLVLLWGLAFAAVAAVIGWETDWGRAVRKSAPPAQAPAAQAVSVALLPDFAIEGGAAARRDTVERPAFVPTRRPAPVPVQEAARTRMQRGQFALTGTAVVDTGSIAFLRETSGGKARTVRAGDTINGLKVAEVGADRVKLVLGDEAEELQLRVQPGPRQTVQPPVPGQPGQPQPPGQPGAQPVPPVPGQPGAPQPPRGQPSPVAGLQPTQAPPGTEAEASLLERRRAARAAQAAAEAAGRASTAPAVPPQSAPAPAAAQGATPGAPDPGWANLYRRLQQPLK
jgi:hypothetical protein